MSSVMILILQRKYNDEVTSTYVKDAMNAGNNDGRVFPKRRVLISTIHIKKDLRLLAEFRTEDLPYQHQLGENISEWG